MSRREPTKDRALVEYEAQVAQMTTQFRAWMRNNSDAFPMIHFKDPSLIAEFHDALSTGHVIANAAAITMLERTLIVFKGRVSPTARMVQEAWDVAKKPEETPH